MVWPSTKCEPSSRIACRVAVRTAGSAEPLGQAFRGCVSGVSPGWMMRAVMPSVQAEAETSNASSFTSCSTPVAAGELVLDQPVGGGGIRHAQQRLRQHHQRKALLGGQRIGMQEVLDAAEPAGPRRGCPQSDGRHRHRSALRRGRARVACASSSAAIASSGGPYCARKQGCAPASPIEDESFISPKTSFPRVGALGSHLRRHAPQGELQT